MERRAHRLTFSLYGPEIAAATRHAESVNTPSFKAFNSQAEISAELRFMLVDFLIGVLTPCSQTTLYAAVGLVDRYCLVRKVKKIHLKLLGLCCAWIASKYHDVKDRTLTLQDLVELLEHTIDVRLFREMEMHVLVSLDWRVAFPTHDLFIDVYLSERFLESGLAADGLYYRFLKTGANFICEILLMYPNVAFCHKPSRVTQTLLLIIHNSYQLYFYDKLVPPEKGTLFMLLLDCFQYRFPALFYKKHFDHAKLGMDIHLVYNCIIGYYKALVRARMESEHSSPGLVDSVFTMRSSALSVLSVGRKRQREVS